MNKLSKAKRDQLILVLIGTVVIIAGLWYAVINVQNQKLVSAKAKADQTADKLLKAENLLRRKTDINEELNQRKAELMRREATLAPTRDCVGWILKNIKPFIVSHNGVYAENPTVPTFSETSMFPKFYYKSATTQFKGTAFYEDFGKFLADFENTYPYFRVQNLDLTPIPETEKISFKFDIIVLIRPADAEGEMP